MKFFRALICFLHLSFREKSSFAEAVFISAYVKICFLFLPFSKIAALIGKPEKRITAHENGHTGKAGKMITDVQKALNRCKRFAPWKPECYNLAITAKTMLGRRHIKSTLFIGLKKNDHGEYEGHAWTKAGQIFVSGEKGSGSYEVHSVFNKSAFNNPICQQYSGS